MNDSLLTKASTPAHFTDAAQLILEYKDYMLAIDCLDCGGEDIDREVQDLPGFLPADKGGIFLAYDESSEALGLAALQTFGDKVGEVRRLYVRESARGQKLGEKLLARVIEEARALGYRRLLLDTFRHLPYARRVYESLGFREIPSYSPLPAQKLIFMELLLAQREE